MADSPAFNPTSIQPKDTDPMIAKVPMDKTDWGFRKEATPSFKENVLPPISHVSNGR
jgi:hypothetical protein